jgi:hypothetical protein
LRKHTIIIVITAIITTPPGKELRQFRNYCGEIKIARSGFFSKEDHEKADHPRLSPCDT